MKQERNSKWLFIGMLMLAPVGEMSRAYGADVKVPVSEKSCADQLADADALIARHAQLGFTRFSNQASQLAAYINSGDRLAAVIAEIKKVCSIQ